MKGINDGIKKALVHEIHAPARRNFPRSRVVIKGVLDDKWEADLVEMIPYKDMGYRYLLTVIDCGSKMAWAEPIKRKTGEEVTAAMKEIFKKAKVTPKHLHTDQGREFYNRPFTDLMKKNNVNHFSTFSTLKATIVERFNRTLKGLMWKHFNVIGSYKWVTHIPQLLADYNGRVHRSTGMEPNKVTKKHENDILARLFTSNSGKKSAAVKRRLPKFRVGDTVRISKHKTLFEKGYLPNWTNEQFSVGRVYKRNVPMYELVDNDGNAIQGKFYEEELKKTAHPGIYLVERIVKKKPKEVLVKWLGMPSSQNSWIPA